MIVSKHILFLNIILNKIAMERRRVRLFGSEPIFNKAGDIT